MQFLKELLEGVHNFSNPGGNKFNLAMYISTATLGKSTTSFTTSGQVTSPAGYLAENFSKHWYISFIICSDYRFC